MKKLNELKAIACRSSTLVPSRLKLVVKILCLSIAFTSIISITPQKASAQERVSFQVFYDELSPYGDWVENPDYGYVWIPHVSHGFVPYGTDGYWILTQEGWTWVSNYSWGWAPFHYGRWFYDSFYGWVWVPGNEWGPGWVTWRRSEGYYGWAPIGPSVSADVAYSNNYNIPYDRWRFVRDRDFGRPDINNYYVSPSGNTEIINNSTVINNIQVDNSRNVRYNAGPSKAEVENRAGKTFTPVAIKQSTGPAQSVKNNQLEIFKPQVEKNISTNQKPAPSKVQDWKGHQQPKEQQDQQAKKQQEQQQNDQQLKKQQQQEQNDQEAKKQQVQQQHDQQVKNQQEQQQHDQQVQKQQEQQQHDQQVKEQQEQQQHDQQVKKQQEQQQHDQQVKKQQQQGSNQPTKKQPAKQKTPQPQKDSTNKN